MRWSLLVALALAGHLTACLYEDFHDGAFCSDKATCPPGQRCSPDGYCLYPCPVLDCVGDACGCEPRTGEDWGNERVCWPDGLCHPMCFHPLPGVSTCGGGFECDTLTDECVLPCGDYDECVNGAICTSSGGISVCRAP